MRNRDIQNTVAVFKREFLAYFNSPVLYVIVVIFLLAAMGFPFFFSRILDSEDVSLTERFFVWHPWIYTVLAPAVGMRLWSEEHRLGTAASYGCVRMAAKDVIDVFDEVGVGTQVMITTNDLPRRATQAVTKPAYQPNAAPLPLQQAIPIEVMPTGKHNFARDSRKIIGPPAPNRPA
jgi:hypothetical protein